MIELNWWDSPRAGLSYLVVPKSGCTSNQIAIATAQLGEGHPLLAPTLEDPMAIHLFKPRVLYADGKMTSRPFRYTWIRPPYRRFASFFRDKVQRAQWNEFGAMGFRNEMTAMECIAHIKAMTPAQMDGHFAPQAAIVFYAGQIQVDFIGRLDRFREDLKSILVRAKTPVKAEWWEPKNNVVGSDWRSVYEDEPEAAEAVYDLHFTDFLAFGFDKDDWKKK